MKIRITTTRDRFNRPLIELNGGPFSGCEINPQDLAKLATALQEIAAEAAAKNCNTRSFSVSHKDVELCQN